MPKKLSKQEPMWQEGIVSGCLTLREHYAGLAMMGALANPHERFENLEMEEISTCAVEQADSLIKALEKK